MDGANCKDHKPNLCFVEEDDECIIEDTISTKGGKAWWDLGQLQAALTDVSKLQIHLLNPSHVEEEDEIAGEDF
jgi:hypothetical protein